MTKKKMLMIIGAVVFLFLIVLIIFLIKSKEVKTYNVKFDTNGGTVVDTQVVNEGDTVVKPSDPKRDGYIFVEWTYENKTYDFSLSVDKDMTLKARWLEKEEDKEMFSVKFDSDGGTTIPNQIVEVNSKVAKPIDPVKEGYKFKYWTLNNEEYDFNKEVLEDLELKAVWEEEVKEDTNKNTNTNNKKEETKKEEVKEEPKPEIKTYTVVFNSAGGSAVNSQTITEGGKVSQPSNPIRSGYTFAGWTLNGSVYDFNSVVNSNITLVAKWNENAKAKYTVTFNSAGGSAVSSQTVTEGSKVSMPSTPKRDGYNFGGWLLNGSAYDFNSSVNGDITLVAKWNQKSYTVQVSPVDQYSPDRILTVYEDGIQISVSAIKYNGVTLCSGSNMVVNMYEISGISSVTVVLTNGTSVTASVK